MPTLVSQNRLRTQPISPSHSVTRTYQFYQSVLMVICRYKECRFDLNEAAIQIEENYTWIFGGKEKGIEELALMFNEVKIRAFLKLASNNH